MASHRRRPQSPGGHHRVDHHHRREDVLHLAGHRQTDLHGDLELLQWAEMKSAQPSGRKAISRSLDGAISLNSKASIHSFSSR